MMVLSAAGPAAAHVGEHHGQGFADHVMTVLIDAGGLIVLGMPALALASWLARRLAAWWPLASRARTAALSAAWVVALGGLGVGGIAAWTTVGHALAPEPIAPERWWTMLALAVVGLTVGVSGLVVVSGVWLAAGRRQRLAPPPKP
ncbi:MAG: hypothetical protein GC150_16435 [Rhizobiales bacterium]|nr:hypothetical protein [Hyphomicrobiales bacterium]